MMVLALTSLPMEPFDTAPDTVAGWYPDPTQRFEYRYYNGERWTADVAQHSNRYIDPMSPQSLNYTGPNFVAQPSRGMAITAFVFALCSLAIAWIPLIFVVGAAGAITALILGIIVLRRAASSSNADHPIQIGQGLAKATVCIALAACGLCVVGFQLTRAVLRDFNDFVNPGPHEVRIDRCDSEDGHAIAQGSIRNRDVETHGYTITIAYRVDGDRVETDSVRVVDVGAGETAEFATASSSVNFSSATLTCTVESVFGPTPFTD